MAADAALEACPIRETGVRGNAGGSPWGKGLP